MIRTILLLASFCLVVSAQTTRHEITAPANPADAKPNNPSVPAVEVLSAQIERVVVMRFKFDTDLLAGLTDAIKEHNITNAVILSAFGSVRGYQVHQVSNRTFPSKNMFVKNPTMPADIIGMGGFVLNGRLHPHITLANPAGSFGGHLEPDTKVFTFAVVTLGVLPASMDLAMLDDKNHR